MKRSALFLSLVALGPFGCGDDKPMDTENPTTTQGIMTLPLTSEPQTSSATDNPTTGAPTTTDATAGMTGGECMVKEDCMPGNICQDGVCIFDPNDCGNAKINIPIVTPNVMLVVDKSGSMVANPNGYWDHDGDDADNDMLKDVDMMTPATAKITRWNSLYDTVKFIVDSFDNSMNLGMILFPSKTAVADYSDKACPVNVMPEVKVGPMNGAAILAALPGAMDTTLKGGTPAAKGLKVAVGELESLMSTQPNFILFLTDGASNCDEEAVDNTGLFEVYDESVPMIVGDAFTNKAIPTYVVGIAIANMTSAAAKDGNPDNTNAYDKLNEVAVAGGVPRPGDTKFYDTQNQIELQDALNQISMQILSCTLKLDPVPIYPDYVEVTVAGVEYGNMQVKDCMTESGWMFTSPAMDEIVLCGQACTDFQMSGALDAAYRCPNSG